MVYSQKKRYKSCHWGGIFSKMMYHLQYVPIYTLGTDMYICGTKKHSLWVNKVQRCTFRKGNALVTTFGPFVLRDCKVLHRMTMYYHHGSVQMKASITECFPWDIFMVITWCFYVILLGYVGWEIWLTAGFLINSVQCLGSWKTKAMQL